MTDLVALIKKNVDNSDVKMKIDSVGKVSIGLASGSAATTMLDIESGSIENEHENILMEDNSVPIRR